MGVGIWELGVGILCFLAWEEGKGSKSFIRELVRVFRSFKDKVKLGVKFSNRVVIRRKKGIYYWVGR
jgi:hypothetical protein